MIQSVKTMYQLNNDPKVDWSKSEKEKPVAEVLFNWKEMPNLTKNGEITKLTYFFNTDFTIPSSQVEEALRGSYKLSLIF